MWKREEAPRPPQPVAPPASSPVVAQAIPVPSTPRVEPVQQEKTNVNIGKSVIIKGEVSGSEDLTIEGQVEGKIELLHNGLTIGPTATIKAQVVRRAVVVARQVKRNIAASEKIEIRDK